MTDQHPTIGQCKHCHEKDQELSEIEFEGKKEWWCEACISGREIEIADSNLERLQNEI